MVEEKQSSQSAVVGENIKLDDEGMVYKKIIYAGDEGATPEKGQEVMVNYTGRLTDGTIFDSSQDKEALKVVIGVGQVIKGWDLGIMSMKLGEKAELTIKPEFGYGAQGSPPQIPGDATLIFEVELIQVNDRRPTRWMMSDDELIKTALKLKDDGNAKFKQQLYKQAEGHYKDALQHAETVKNDTEELKDLKVKVNQNMSVCTNNTGDFKETIANCTKAIKIDATATKAWYLRSVAHLKLNNFDEAATDCKMAVTLNPSDVNLRNHYKAIGDQKKAKSAASKKAMAAMFAEGFYNDKEAPKVAKSNQKLPDFDSENAQVFFDMAVGTEGEEGYEKERVVFELFSKQVPKTAENFRALCTGEKGSDFHYKGNKFHRIISGFMMQGGDTTAGNGTGGKSIYGEKFEDEQIWYPHTHKGVLSMANAGPNTNGSQFFICYGATPHLNEKHTIYGRVIKGYSICEKAEAVEKGAQDKPLQDVTIVDCGELTGDEKLSAEQADFLANYN